MKNFYFSVILFLTIISLAFISNSRIRNNFYYYASIFTAISQSSKITETEIMAVSRAKSYFNAQKNMLQLFISKEHIKDIETNILLIEHFLYENELSECKTRCIEIISVINQLTEATISID